MPRQGLVNTAHQLGSALGLGDPRRRLRQRRRPQLLGVSTALSWGTGLLALCLVVVVAVIVPAQRRPRVVPRAQVIR